MNGMIIQLGVGLGPMVAIDLTAPPSLKTLQRCVEGNVQEVPHFNTFQADPDQPPQRCIAFCNEEGKWLNDDTALPVNKRATKLWEESLEREGRSLLGPDGKVTDMLFGPVVVLVGDDEFLGAI